MRGTDFLGDKPNILKNKLFLAGVLLIVGMGSAILVGALLPKEPSLIALPATPTPSDLEPQYESQITAAGLNPEQASALTKSLQRSGYAGVVHVDAILTPPEFYPLTRRPQEAAQFGADRYLVFVTNEHLHNGDLPKQFAPILRVDGARLHVPSETRVLVDVGHLRTTVFTFKDVPAAIHKEPHLLELMLPAADKGSRTVLSWGVPVDLPESN